MAAEPELYSQEKFIAAVEMKYPFITFVTVSCTIPSLLTAIAKQLESDGEALMLVALARIIADTPELNELAQEKRLMEKAQLSIQWLSVEDVHYPPQAEEKICAGIVFQLKHTELIYKAVFSKAGIEVVATHNVPGVYQVQAVKREGISILIVDDEPTSRKLLERAIKMLIAKILHISLDAVPQLMVLEQASSGDEALLKIFAAKANPYDLIFLDYFMGQGKITGLGVAEKIREAGIITPICFITGALNGLDLLTEPKAKIRSFSMSDISAEYFAKPINVHVLNQRLLIHIYPLFLSEKIKALTLEQKQVLAKALLLQLEQVNYAGMDAGQENKLRVACEYLKVQIGCFQKACELTSTLKAEVLTSPGF